MTAATLAGPRSGAECLRRVPCLGTDARETERQLLVRYHDDGDLAAREELCERFLPLARDLALRYTYTDEPLDDLVQVASLGLIKAIDRFEPGRGTKFTSYAAPTILGELKRHFRDKGWSLHVPRDLQERTLAVSRATEALSKELGRSPKVREVAAASGLLGRAGARGAGGGGELRGRVARRPGRAATTTSRRRSWTCSATSDTSYELVESREAIASTWASAARGGAPGARAALHARPDAARDRRADRLLADARVAAAAARAQPAGDRRSRRMSERAFSTAKPSQSLLK